MSPKLSFLGAQDSHAVRNQGIVLHLVVMSPYEALGHNSFSDLFLRPSEF